MTPDVRRWTLQTFKNRPKLFIFMEQAPSKKSLFSLYKDRIVSAISDFADREIDTAVEKVRDSAILKKKLRETVVIASISAAGATMLLYGAARILSGYFPLVNEGMNFMAIGTAVLISAVIYKRI